MYTVRIILAAALILAPALILATALWPINFVFYIEDVIRDARSLTFKKKMSGEPSPAVEDEVTPNPHYSIPSRNYPIQPEDYTQFKQEPRIQLVWRHPLHKKETVWSIGLHGEDLREAIDANWLYTEAGESVNYIRSIYGRTIRSPDNRYIVLNLEVDTDYHSIQLRLYDLKTRAMTVMAVFGYRESPGFSAWALDSKAVLFYSDGTMWEYRVDSKTLKKNTSDKKMDDAGNYLGFNYSEVDFSGYGKYWTVSPDGKFAAFVTDKKILVESSNDVESFGDEDNPVFSLPRRGWGIQFLNAGKLLFVENDYFKTMEIPSGEVNELFEFNMASDILEFSIFNRQGI